MEAEEQQFSEELILSTVNQVLSMSAVEDNKMEDMNEAMLKVLNREIQAATAAKQFGVRLKDLETLVQATERRLNNQADGNKVPKDGKAGKRTLKGMESESVDDEQQIGEAEQAKAKVDKKKPRSSGGHQKPKSSDGGRKRSKNNNNDSNIVLMSSPPAEKGKRAGRPRSKQSSGGDVGANGKENEEQAQTQKEEINDNVNKKDIANGDGDGASAPRGRGRKRKRAPSPTPVDSTPTITSTSSETTDSKKKRHKRNTVEVLKDDARKVMDRKSSPKNESRSEMDSMQMALSVYEKGGGTSEENSQQKQRTKKTPATMAIVPATTPTMPSSLALQRTRRSMASTNLVHNVTTPVVKALTWRDTPPKENFVNDEQPSPQEEQLNNTYSFLDISTMHKNQLIKDNPRWRQFSNVTENMADEVLSRVVCRNDAQREKQQSMRGAILDIILNSYTIKRAKEEHKVGESTLRRYTREVKLHLEQILGVDVVSDQLLSQLNSSPADTTLDQLRTLLMSQPSSSTSASAPRMSASVQRPQSRSATGRTRSIPGSSDRKKTPATGSRSKKKEKESDKKLTEGANKKPIDKAPSLSPQSAENEPPMGNILPGLLGGPQNHGQELLTLQRNERIDFRGTKEEFRALITQHLTQKYAGNVAHLASLTSNFMHAQIHLGRQQQTFGIPYNLLWATVCMLARYIKMESLDFTDIEEDEMSGEGGGGGGEP